jgi:predicted RNA polymerase sigma factor
MKEEEKQKEEEEEEKEKKEEKKEEEEEKQKIEKKEETCIIFCYMPCLQNTQEMALLFIRWVTLAYTAMHRKISAVCQDDYCNHWEKHMHIKDR